jgi:hypothetical protein
MHFKHPAHKNRNKGETKRRKEEREGGRKKNGCLEDRKTAFISMRSYMVSSFQNFRQNFCMHFLMKKIQKNLKMTLHMHRGNNEVRHSLFRYLSYHLT